MTWTAYQITFRLESPLHVGHLKIGNLQRTRHYVPGKTLWGALTARLTRDFPELGEAYQTVGQHVSNELAFSYFYPAIDHNEPLYPDYTSNGLCYGSSKMAPDEFAWRVLSSYASTAVDARRTAAEEGSLHEVEFISPRDREKGDPVYLVGYIFKRRGCQLRWQKTLDRLQLGGERGYGWGRVSKCELGKLSCEKLKLFDLCEVDLRQERLIITMLKGSQILAHTSTDGIQARGQIEPWLGRETLAAERHGAKLSQAQVCWVPGSRIVDESRLIICPYGLWEPLSPSTPGSAKMPGDRQGAAEGG
jgi:hypothetical protein